MTDTNGHDLELKSVEAAEQASVQARARQQGNAGFPVITLLAQSNQLISPWWSKRRDLELSRFWIKVPHLAGAYYTLASKLSAVPFRVEPRDTTIKAHMRLSDWYQGVLEEESEFGQGWQELSVKGFIDLWQTDNGLFWEVIGDGKKDGPIVGPALGLAHLDSYRCQRTGNLEFPVIYQDTDGSRYKLHRSRVIFAAQLPSPRAEMNGVGLCWTSRCFDVAQTILDIMTYKQEKLGSRPQRSLMITRGGLDPETLGSAFQQAAAEMTGQGLTRFSRNVIAGSAMAPDAGVDIIDLASLPDGFDESTSITLGMFAIALAGAVPPRWLWPATESGATKADAMYQHVAGLTGGPGATLAMIARALGGSERGGLSSAGKFLPPTLKLVFDFQDDEEDRTQAEIHDVRSQSYERLLNSGVYSVRVVREQALAAGDISDSQFEAMELDEGRLPDGSDVLTLFYSRDPQVQGLLSIDAVYSDPLDVATNDAALMQPAIEKQMRICQQVQVNAVNASLKNKARQCEAALQALAELYKPKSKPPAAPPPMPAPVAAETAPLGEPETGETEPPVTEEGGTDQSPFEVKAGMDEYRMGLRSAVRGLWSGVQSNLDFLEQMRTLIERRFTQAWYEGAAEFGIKPTELSDEERRRLREQIDGQLPYILGLADAVQAGSKANGGPLAPLMQRTETWAGGYDTVRQIARGMAGGDDKRMWTLGNAEHCGTCLKLAGKVKRYSYWSDMGILPHQQGNSWQDCQGYNCACSLEHTEAPVSRGPLPRLP